MTRTTSIAIAHGAEPANDRDGLHKAINDSAPIAVTGNKLSAGNAKHATTASGNDGESRLLVLNMTFPRC
jgi:hypothetical protein